MKEENTYKAPPGIDRFQSISIGAGVIGLIICVIGFVMTNHRESTLRGWLLGFIFWGGIAFGGLGILLLQYLTGGAWGVVIRRIAEACSRTIPIIGLLFIPIALGVYQLYDFANLLGHDRIVDARGWYMQPTWWVIRTLIYLVVFSAIAYFLTTWSAKQDKTEDYDESAEYLSKAYKFSGPAIILYVVLVTFATVDWTMSLEPHWFSTMWGFLYVVGWGLSGFCFAIMILAFLNDKAPMKDVLGKRHFHDIGKLMLAFVMVWAYFNFSQYLIIWSGNLTEETPFYLVRSKGVWGAIGIILIVFHFAFPFLVLLLQDFKRHARLLAYLAAFILVMRLLDMFYMIGPSPRVGEVQQHMLSVPFRLSIFDFAGPLAIGGIWLFFFFRELKSRPMVPYKDPYFENAIKHGGGH